MRHLTPDQYTRQPWKNGKGVTVELARSEVDGALLWRLSMATVAEDGPFSLFPGIDRNLTVISGAGFRLTGDGVALDCRPLVPVAFPGDVAVVATGTAAGPSDDFNVMTARHLPRPEVMILSDAVLPEGPGLVALFALAPLQLSGHALARHDLLMGDGLSGQIAGGPGLMVRLQELPD